MNNTLPIALIVACGRNHVIGLNNRMPWHLPADLKYFKQITMGKPVIMGRKTWDSIGRPLPGRLNLVVSRQPDLQLEGAQVCASLEMAIEQADIWAREQGVTELMLIGGAQLYRQALEQAQRVYLTRVDLAPEGDTWFPELDDAQWELVGSNKLQPEDGPGMNFEVYQRH